MKGFFSTKETQSNSRPDGKTYSCASCGLYHYVLSPRMEPFGKFEKKILNVGEAPGEMEDRRGKQWQGKVGRRLQKEYQQLGYDLFGDCLNINAINCRPTTKSGANRAPSPYEVACCRSRVLKVIQEHKPKVIIALGGQAVTSLLGHRWKKDLGGIMKWRGWTIPDRDLNAWLCPVWHPSYVERQASREVDTIWRQDLRRALSMSNAPFPQYTDEKEQVEIIDSPASLDPFPDLVAFDYETTGLKPHAPGHRIVCAAVAYNEECAQVFMMPRTKSQRKQFTNLLRAKDIRKMAHNMKFEEAWSVVRLRQSVKNWYWDSMLAAHILDNRPGITGLKFQTYVNFGVVDYDSEISPYLKAKDSKNANAFNQILKLIKTKQGREKLMTYCGLDALYEYKLAMRQMGWIEKR